MKSLLPMHDSDPAEYRLLARLLETGTLLLDEHAALRFASAGACALFGADDEADLRRAWPTLAPQLQVAAWPRAPADGNAFVGHADVVTARGPRAVRFELHAADGERGERVLLVRDRAALAAGDHALVLASEAEANRHVLTGLVHAAKGPLNNFSLTLSLLASNVALGDAAGQPDVAAKRTRYLDVLRSEAARLNACIEEIDQLTRVHAPAREVIDIAALSQACARVLRHAATMREVRIDVDVPSHPVDATGDPHLVRLALLSFAICVIDLTPAGGRLCWQVVTPRQHAGVRVSLATSHPPLPPALVESLFRIACTAASPHVAAIAARVVVEAQGGDVAVHDGSTGFSIVLPGA